MSQNEQQMAVGTVVCLPPGWDVVRQPKPAVDDRLGRAAIEAMDVILEVMRSECHADVAMERIDRIATNYIAARWHIQKESGT